MVKVLMDEMDVVDMLVNRLAYWTNDETATELFRKMYESLVDGGVFECVELDVMQIVDNDWVNYCYVVSEGDEGYEELKALYEDGEYDISCEHINGWNFIEAEYNGSFLVRC